MSYRWEKWRDTHNWVLLFVAVLAISRGVLYTIPTKEILPRGLDLLPKGILSIFGVLWLSAGIYALLRLADYFEQKYARRYLAGMALTWATIYFSAIYFTEGNVVPLIGNAVVYVVIAGLSWASRPRTVIRYKTIFIVHGKNDGDGFVMLESADGEEDGTPNHGG
jgi:hypothetical protein